MKTPIQTLLAGPGKIGLRLLICLGLISIGTVQAQTFNTLHSFTGAGDGSSPIAELITSGDTLYGTARYGGDAGDGVVFSVKTDGTGFMVLHSFTATLDDGSGNDNLTNSDGSVPFAGLVLSGDTLYGTTYEGGSSGSGTIFSIKTNGTSFTVLYTFTPRVEVFSSGNYTNGDGAGSQGTLLLSGNTLYGTTDQGGTANYGTVFKVDTSGNNFTTLHSFSGSGGEGGHPYAGLILLGNTLYGTTFQGSVVIDGSLSSGTVFAVDTDGGNFTTLHSFPSLGYPSCRLVALGNMLYGTTFQGGGLGILFTLDTSGNNYMILHTFTGGLDGDSPYAGLILSGNTLYGTTSCTGSGGSGTVFSVKPDGSNFTTLYSFAGGNDGKSPCAEVLLSGSTLYGTALNGGSGNGGTVFSLTLPCASAEMAIAQYAGISISGSIGCTYEIDYTTNLATGSPWIPLVTNTLVSNPFLFIDTNAISGSRFYRAITQ
jgi:uncharacterized repeat protein (TIGR03803 family)